MQLTHFWWSVGLTSGGWPTPEVELAVLCPFAAQIVWDEIVVEVGEGGHKRWSAVGRGAKRMGAPGSA